MRRRPLKLSRRDLTEPKHFLTLADRANEFLKAYGRAIALGIACAVTVFVVALAIYQYEARLDRIAAEQFYEAFSALEKNQLATAERGFEKLSRQYPNRTAGRLASFYLASCYLQEGRLAQARDRLLRAIPTIRDPQFQGMALVELGSVYEQQGDLKRALDAYRKASELDSPEKLRAQLAVARLMAKLGEKNGAIEAYRQFLKQHPYASERQEALEELASLGATALSEPPATQQPPSPPEKRQVR